MGWLDGAGGRSLVAGDVLTGLACGKTDSGRGGKRGRPRRCWNHKPQLHLFEFFNQGVYCGDEGGSISMREIVDQGGTLMRQSLLACDTGPATHLAIREQRQSPQVATLAGILKVTEEILKTQLQRF